ncbi:hypothetical protein GCM10010505_42870 [Kitasatospora aburaviensis]
MEEDRALGVQLAHLLAFGAGEAEELLQQSGLAQGDLAVVLVQVQGAALVAGVGARLAVVDGDGDVVALQDAGAGQAGGAGSDDRDAGGAGGVQGGALPFSAGWNRSFAGSCRAPRAPGAAGAAWTTRRSAPGLPPHQKNTPTQKVQPHNFFNQAPLRTMTA